MKQEVSMDVTNKLNLDYFNKMIEENFVFLNKGYYAFNEQKKWKIKCSKNKSSILEPHNCSQKVLAFLNEMLLNSKRFTCVKDYSKNEVNGQCYNVQILSDNYELSLSHSICINISVIIPFFHVHVLELKRKTDNFHKWDGVPDRKIFLEKNTYRGEIRQIKDFLVSKLCLKDFPEELIYKLVPGIFTEDISKEDFTYFNAFFQREYDTR